MGGTKSQAASVWGLLSVGRLFVRAAIPGGSGTTPLVQVSPFHFHTSRGLERWCFAVASELLLVFEEQREEIQGWGAAVGGNRCVLEMFWPVLCETCAHRSPERSRANSPDVKHPREAFRHTR